MCWYGYQTGDNSELQTVIVWSMMVLLHFSTSKCSFKNIFPSFPTIKICEYFIMPHKAMAKAY